MQAELTIDPKTRYLIKTLSRTYRKDYENYVINAIWHRLGNHQLEVISQQYIKDNSPLSGRSHYFIDLYFPALNLGIECDELYHSTALQQEQDRKRELTIFDILYEVSSEAYEAIHVRVGGSFEALEQQIEQAVLRIEEKIQEIQPPIWKMETAAEYYSTRTHITVGDRKGFNSINTACNVLFAAGRKPIAGGASRAYFSLPAFTGTELEGYKCWFPKLAIPVIDKNGQQLLIAASATGWHNQLTEEGNVIIEKNEKNQSYIPDLKKRIVFMKYKDPLGYYEYKFVGIFEHERVENGVTYFRRVREDCPLIHASSK